MKTRHFTRDCKMCPFWDAGRCTMINECSTMEDLFGGGTFYGAYETVRYFSVNDKMPFDPSYAYFVDIDGMYVDKVPEDPFDLTLKLVNDQEIVGVLVPKSDK